MLKPVLELADSIVRQLPPKMKWMWGEALLGYALAELDDYTGRDRYGWFLKEYCDYWVENRPRVDQSDTAAPALITYAMQKKTGSEDYRALTDRVLDYIRNEPRILDDAVNHLGRSFEGRFYPRSIWVDSLMMFGVFTARYASENRDDELLDFAARQPGLYSGYMQNDETGLWSHSYRVKRAGAYPADVFWGRGNGWVVCSLPMILNWIPESHPERAGIIDIFKKTARAVLEYQREDGYFDTVFDHSRKTCREASATALIAAGLYEGVGKGWLDGNYGDAAEKAFRALCGSLIRKKGEVYMPEISGPTIPLPLFPFPGYKFIPRGKNWSYGVAAFIFAGISGDRLEKERPSPKGSGTAL